MTEPSASTITFTSGDFTNNNTYYVKEASLTTPTEVYYKRSNNASGYGIKLEHQSDGSTKVYANAGTDGSNAPEQLVLNSGTPAATVEITSSNIAQTLEGQEASGNTNWVFTLTSAHLWSGTPPSGGTSSESISYSATLEVNSSGWLEYTIPTTSSSGTYYLLKSSNGGISWTQHGQNITHGLLETQGSFDFDQTLIWIIRSPSEDELDRWSPYAKKVHCNFW